MSIGLLTLVETKNFWNFSEQWKTRESLATSQKGRLTWILWLHYLYKSIFLPSTAIARSPRGQRRPRVWDVCRLGRRGRKLFP